jgi:antitoxin ParD1/3/4
MPRRNVFLTEHHKRFIERLIRSGRYKNASEVLREGLRLFEQRETREAARLAALREAACIGFRDIEEGRFEDVSGVWKSSLADWDERDRPHAVEAVFVHRRSSLCGRLFYSGCAPTQLPTCCRAAGDPFRLCGCSNLQGRPADRPDRDRHDRSLSRHGGRLSCRCRHRGQAQRNACGPRQFTVKIIAKTCPD